jgi:L-lactate dehydrogenase (cytochrome)
MKPASVADYREAARRRLPRVLFDYIDGGSYAEATLAANVAEIGALKLRQRVLRDVSKLSTETQLFGQTLAMPVVLSPVGLAGMYARRGETQAARAAKAAGVPFTLSTVGVCTAAEVAQAAGTPPWFQLYMTRDRAFMADVLASTAALGCPVLMFTVDLPVPGARYRDVRNGMIATTNAQRLSQAVDGLLHPAWLWDVHLHGRPHTLGTVAEAAKELKRLVEFWSWIGRNFDASITWDDIAWVRQHWAGPIVIKGILDADDAREAVKVGVDGIVVSNHGGRQLDGAPSTISVMPAIKDAVGDDMTLLLDCGIRSGLDVVKAMASGADACLIGRAWAWALGARGEAGVSHVISVIKAEMLVALALTGCTDVKAVGRELLAD